MEGTFFTVDPSIQSWGGGGLVETHSHIFGLLDVQGEVIDPTQPCQILLDVGLYYDHFHIYSKGGGGESPTSQAILDKINP